MDAPLFVQVGVAPFVAATAFYVLMLRPWRPRRMIARRAPGIDLLFVSGLVVGGLAVLQPAPFDRAAVALVDTTPLPASLDDVDARIATLERLPETMWDDLVARFGWSSGAVSEPIAPTPGQGPVAGAVLPAVHGIVSGILRLMGWSVSLLVLCVAQLMRSLSGRARPSVAPETLRGFDHLLDDRVAALEEALHTRRRAAAQPAPE